MITAKEKRGGAPVGFLAELDGIGAASIIYLRMWHNGPESQADVWTDLSSSLGADHGRKALKAFETLCSLCSQHGRRQLRSKRARPCAKMARANDRGLG